MLSATSECLQIMGGLGYLKTHPYERYLRDARVLTIYEVRMCLYVGMCISYIRSPESIIYIVKCKYFTCLK